jgi:hypothetical protein
MLRADVIVLANRTPVQVPFRFVPVSGQAQQLTLPAGDTMPLFLDGKGDVFFASREGPKHYTLDANCAYYFGRANDGRVDLQKIGLNDDGTAAQGRKLPGSAARTGLVTIPVKILVDEEEPARQQSWERRLRTRVEAASAIFERYFRIRFQVVATGTWASDNAITDFFDALAEFEREVKPAPARIAIGFTSQWQMVRGRVHMAGTRGPLHTHVLVREGSPEVNEAARLELLVHELGHYLGAAHSPEQQSIMRPVLGSNRTAQPNLRIQFDPVNALAMGMVVEEIRRGNITETSQLQYVTRCRLEQIYKELGRVLTDDPAPMHYAMLMRTSETPAAMGAQKVLQQIVHAAVDNRSLPIATPSAAGQASRKDGDGLTDYLVHAAARAAAVLPPEQASQAFLLAIAIGLDDSPSPVALPILKNQMRVAEATSERMIRLAALGKPTLHGRSDLAKRFFTAAYLSTNSTPEAVQENLLDAALNNAVRSGGLSFQQIAADRAGCRFASALLGRKVSLTMLASKLPISSFTPDVDSFPENISAKDLAEQYGKKSDPRFVKQLKEIDDRIAALPVYRAIATGFSR